MEHLLCIGGHLKVATRESVYQMMQAWSSPQGEQESAKKRAISPLLPPPPPHHHHHHHHHHHRKMFSTFPPFLYSARNRWQSSPPGEGVAAAAAARAAAAAAALATAPSWLLYRSASIYFHIWLVVWCCCYWSHTILYLRSHGHESLFYVRGILRTSLQEWDTKLISILLHMEKRVCFRSNIRYWTQIHITR